jgi:excinuclease UvrABC nuclease subunit
MPIGPGHGGFAFNVISITLNAPSASGVYALYDANGYYVYFGESNDIQRRLLEHLRNPITLLSTARPAYFAFDLMPAHLRVTHQNNLIRRYNPSCNQIFG